MHDQGCGDSAAEAMPRGVVGFEVGPRCRLAAVDRGDAASIAGWFELGHGPLGQVVWGPCLQGNLPRPGGRNAREAAASAAGR